MSDVQRLDLIEPRSVRSETFLDEKIAELAERVRETELRLAVEAAGSRLLALALAEVEGEPDPEDL